MRYQLFFLPCVIGAVVACSSGKSDARSLAAAVDRFRAASNLEKPSLAPAIGALACSDTGVCAARDTCAAAAMATARALTLKDEVARGVKAINARTLSPESAEAQALTGKLDEAERSLQSGHAAMAGCEEAVRRLRRRYGF